MARRPRGTLPQLQSDTVLFGHIASRLEGVDQDRLDAWAKELGIQPGAEVLRRRPVDANRLKGRGRAASAVRPWLLLDWREFDFFVAAVRLRAETGERQLDQLEQVPGVIELLACGQASELLALVVYQRRHEQEALRMRLAEFGELLSWAEVDDHRQTAAISTLRWLTRDAAEREGLRSPP